MTVKEIRRRVGKYKRLSRAGLYLHLRALKIKPAGVARPAIYPDDAAAKIIIRLGFKEKVERVHSAKNVSRIFAARHRILANPKISPHKKVSFSRQQDAKIGGAR